MGEIITLALKDVPVNIFVQIKRLNLGSAGAMHSVVRDLNIDYEDNYAHYYLDGQNVLGVALTWERKFLYGYIMVPTLEAGFYIKPSHRRTGIGRKLFATAAEFCEKQNKHMLVWAWDSASHRFFESCRPLIKRHLYDLRFHQDYIKQSYGRE